MRSLALLIAVVGSQVCLAQSGPKADPGESIVPGFLMTAPPKIDGIVDPSEWESVPHFDGLVDSMTGGPVPFTARFWLAYDNKYIYFAAQMPDDNPKKIQASEYRTNVDLGSDDQVVLIVDTYGTLQNFNVFNINPRGATKLRIAGGRAAKREWMGDIEAKGRITDTGWESEVRIPWSVMKLPGAGVHDLRFNAYRFTSRYGRDTSWRAIETNIQSTPRWTGVQLPEPPPRVLQLLPYNYSGVAPDGKVANMGLDLKTSINESLDFVGSVNPDFRNIENQVLSLDHSYFARLAGESRPFFLEGGQFFRTSGDAPIFTSQRIQAFDVGNKVYGKLGPKTDLAVLNTTDINHENNLVFNALHQLSPQVTFRAAYAGVKQPNLRNDAYHMEYRNSNGPWTFYYQNAATSDSGNGKGVRHNPGVFYSNGNYNGYFEYSSVSSRFDPKLGFAPQTGFHGLDGMLESNRNLAKGPILQERYGVNFRSWDKFGGGNYINDVTVWTDHALRSGTDLSLNYGVTEFNGYQDHLASVAITRPWQDNYRRWAVDYSFGEVQGATYRAAGLNMLYRPTQMLQLTGSYQLVDHAGTERQAILSANYDLGNDRSISGRALLRDGNWNAYVAYKRSGNAGMEYFVILGDPNAQKFRSSLILKVTYPLQLFLGGK